MKKATVAALLLVAFLVCPSPSGADDKDSSEALHPRHLVQMASYGPYVVRIYRDEEQHIDLLRITKDGAETHLHVSGIIRIGPFYEENKEQAALLKVGRDITGDGQPNLVIADYSGGAHCCLSYYVFSVGKEFKLIDVLNAEDSDLARFIDVDGDGVLEFAMNDWTFEYWNVPFASSPAPRVYLAYRGEGYRIALDLMRQPSPSPESETKLINKIRADPTWNHTPKIGKTTSAETVLAPNKATVDALMSLVPKGVKRSQVVTLLRRWDRLETYDADGWTNGALTVPPEVWSHMLHHIYTGHADLAWNFLERCWPDGKGGMATFLADFMTVLSTSPYWPEIEKTLEHP